MKKQVDIVIAGGGLAGLLAACRLARTGRSICLVAPPRLVDRRTTALLGGSIDTLKAMDVWTELAPISQALRSIRILDGTRRLIRAPEVQFNAGDIGLKALGYNVPNDPLLSALGGVAEAAGVTRSDARVSGVEVANDAISVACDDGVTIAAKLLVAADGQGSPCREFAGIAISRAETGQSAIVCNFGHTAPHDDVSTEFHTESGPFTMVPLSPGRSALVWVVDNDDAAGFLEKTPEQLSDAIYEQSHALLGAVHVEGQAQAFKLASGSAERLSSDRLILIGEAAHIIPPIAAQGFNLT
ncbi:MAG: FAD-dependent monooxygenase, partial [Alphaproteobacteria bacterium]